MYTIHILRANPYLEINELLEQGTDVSLGCLREDSKDSLRNRFHPSEQDTNIHRPGIVSNVVSGNHSRRRMLDIYIPQRTKGYPLPPLETLLNLQSSLVLPRCPNSIPNWQVRNLGSTAIQGIGTFRNIAFLYLFPFEIHIVEKAQTIFKQIALTFTSHISL